MSDKPEETREPEEEEQAEPESAWSVLAEVAARHPDPPEPPRWRQWVFVAQDWLAAPVSLRLVLLIAAFAFALGAAAMAFISRPAATPARAAAAPTMTPETPTPTVGIIDAVATVVPVPVASSKGAAASAATTTPTPTALPVVTVTPTSTPLTYFVVWTPNAAGAFVREKPSALAQQLDVVPNGARVIWTGSQKKNQGFVWYEVQYPAKDGMMSTGWMANIVLYDVQPVGYLRQQAAFYVDANGAPGAFLRWLPKGTPLVEVNANGQWALVRLPDDSEGWVKAKAIVNTTP